MIATATALISAVGDSIMEDEVMDFARFITHTRNETDLDDFAKAMYMYSGILASNVADRVVKILLDEAQLKELMTTIDEIESMRNEILDEENN